MQVTSLTFGISSDKIVSVKLKIRSVTGKFTFCAVRACNCAALRTDPSDIWIYHQAAAGRQSNPIT